MDEFDKEELRWYQLLRMRYYFALIDCDSVETADAIYKNLDGMEFEHSSNKIDLRFINEEWETKYEVRDRCDTKPKAYDAPEFFTKALQHSNVSLASWDENPRYRTQFFRKTCANTDFDDIDEEQLKTYLADESEGEGSDFVIEASDDENVVLKKKARAPFLDLLSDLKKKYKSDLDVEDQVQVKFNSIFADDAGEKILEARDEKLKAKDESIFETKQRIRKAKRKEKFKLRDAQKNKENGKIEQDGGLFSDDEVDEGALAFMQQETKDTDNQPDADKIKKKRNRKKKKQKNETEEEKNEAAKLGLLMMNPNEENFKNREKNFKIDVDDSRMGAVFNDPDFAIDPTNPNFKSTEGIQEFQRRARKRDKKKKKKKEKSGAVLNNLVDSIKAKANKFKKKKRKRSGLKNDSEKIKKKIKLSSTIITEKESEKTSEEI